jgi:class 3 adenylate cyclase
VKNTKLQARVGIATGLVVVGDLVGETSDRLHTLRVKSFEQRQLETLAF